MKLKKDREAEAPTRQEAKEREEAERAAAEERRRLEVREEMRLYEDITFKIVGVTYKNADRHSRQAILRKLKFGDYPLTVVTLTSNLGNMNLRVSPPSACSSLVNK